MDIVAFLFAIIIIDGTKGITNYSISRSKTTWAEAKKYCKCDGGRLLKMASLTDERLLDLLQSSSDLDLIWMDGHVSFSPFVYYQGCLMMKRSQTSQTRATLAGNSIFHCTKFCENEDLLWDSVAINGNDCYCLKDRTSIVSYKDASTSCKLCQGGNISDEICEASTIRVDVYIKLPFDLFINTKLAPVESIQCLFYGADISNDWGEIKSCSHHKALKYLCEMDYLNKIKHSLCRDYQQEKKLLCEVLEFKTWMMDANQSCINLSSLRSYNSFDFPSLPIFIWAGFFRTSRITTPKKSTLGDKCLAFNKTQPNVWFSLDCSNITSFICTFNSSTDQQTPSYINNKTLLPTLFTETVASNISSSTTPSFRSMTLKNKYIYIVSAGLIVVIVVLLTGFIIVYRKYRSLYHSLYTSIRPSTGDTTIRYSTVISDSNLQYTYMDPHGLSSIHNVRCTNDTDIAEDTGYITPSQSAVHGLSQQEEHIYEDSNTTAADKTGYLTPMQSVARVHEIFQQAEPVAEDKIKIEAEYVEID